jgi:hypothetical protein
VTAGVYFTQNTLGHVKIGHSASVDRRIASLQGGNSRGLKVLRVVSGGRATEKWLHKQFSESRIRGEWFRFVPAMLTVVPPDEIPQRIQIKPRLNLTLRERIRDARRFGLGPKLNLLSIVSHMTDDEAQACLDALCESLGEAAA